MAKIQIQDLPGDMSISHEDMRKVFGGIQITINADDEKLMFMNLFSKIQTTAHHYLGSSSSSSSSSGGSSGSKPTYTTMESK